jgi:uncharacterized membrane protein YgcG
MGIAVVGRVDGATSEFAPAVLDRWGVGSKGCNTGIVLGIAIEDRSMYLATGGGAKEYVSDAEAQAIIDRMKPLLRDNRVADALEQCVSDVLRVLNGEHVAESNWGSLLAYGLFGGIFCCIINADRRKRNRYLKVKRVLTEMERQAAQAKASKYHVESCAICLETFKDAPEPTRVLACGHTFHTACLSGWERGTCPICRAPDVEAASPAAPEARYLIREDSEAPRSDTVSRSSDAEFQFRLRRTRALYPDVVTDSMVNRWAYGGPDRSLVADVAFVRAAPGYNSGGSGGGGGSSSFGGGGSGGGGGAGGGW